MVWLWFLLPLVACSSNSSEDQTQFSGELFSLDLPESGRFMVGEEIPFQLISSNNTAKEALPNDLRRFELFSDSTSLAEAFNTYLADSAQLDAVLNVDFSRFQVLGVFHGYTEEATDAIELSRITQRENDAVGVVRFTTRGAGCSLVRGLFSPYQFVLIPRMEQTLEIAAEVIRNKPCILDPNLALDINARFINRKSVVLTWNKPNYSDPIVGYEIQGDPIPNSQIGEEYLEIDTLIPGMYQRVDITTFTANDEGRQTTPIYLSAEMPQGVTEDGPKDGDFSEFVASIAGNSSVNCETGSDGFTLKSPCLIDSFQNGTAAAYSSVSIGTDSLAGIGAVVTVDRDVFLFSIESGVADRSFSGFQCLSPVIVESRLVCIDCQNSTDNRCKFFSGEYF